MVATPKFSQRFSSDTADSLVFIAGWLGALSSTSTLFDALGENHRDVTEEKPGGGLHHAKTAQLQMMLEQGETNPG